MEGLGDMKPVEELYGSDFDKLSKNIGMRNAPRRVHSEIACLGTPMRVSHSQSKTSESAHPLEVVMISRARQDRTSFKRRLHKVQYSTLIL